ncbi:ParB/RepB/Spo0J family partition protein [Sphingomonas floccifaciens]|uniref:ParB/RepB/Spo0J family partition protein n=1 Tax=Sphingomonas floccifaciens TaxID=1844115 RepID=A0ABW4NBA9_9SPHN
MTDDTPTATRSKPRSGLGRGLSALLGDAVVEAPVGSDGAPVPTGVRTLPVSALTPHPDQPRRHFDEDKLDELARSIAARGLIQPIVVRPHGHDYQIVAGERRWRAAQRARLHEIPVIVRELSDADTMEIALVENIQRADLNAIEEAEAYKRLIDQFGHTQEALGKLVDKSRSHVSNLLRLLDLPDGVRKMLADGELEMGHARALIGAPDPVALARRVVDDGLSVRDTEKLARSVKPDARRGRTAAAPRQDSAPNADIAALERQLGDLLGLGIRIAHGEKGGTLTLTYSTLDQLDMVCQRLSGERI